MPDRRPTNASPARPFAPPRRLVLGLAFLLALAVAAVPRAPVAFAQDAKPAASPTAGDSQGATTAPGAKTDAEPAKETPAKESSAKEAPAKEGAGTQAPAPAKEQAGTTVKKERDAKTGQQTITVTKNGKTVTVTGVPGDREFDSFGQIVDTEPALATMIIGVVAVVFLSPVIAIALILAYRMRKIRMQNETMLRLAEKGVVAPGEAMNAIASGTVPSAMRQDASGRPPIPPLPTAPVDSVKEIRIRTVWSDLRKGVILGAVGLGVTVYYLARHGVPSSVGLVLLFVGIGYVVLWWFEDRQMRPRNGGAGTPPGAGSGGTS